MYIDGFVPMVNGAHGLVGGKWRQKWTCLFKVENVEQRCEQGHSSQLHTTLPTSNSPLVFLAVPLGTTRPCQVSVGFRVSDAPTSPSAIH